jgi:hypothetical protein
MTTGTLPAGITVNTATGIRNSSQTRQWKVIQSRSFAGKQPNKL